MDILERFSQQMDAKKKKGQMPPLPDYLENELVTFFKVSSQQEALESLVDLLDAQGKLLDREEFMHAIMEREKIVSTGIGIGVAIPHAKLSGYEEFFVAIGILKGEGIEWESLDGLPVRIVLMIGGPENRQTEYLNILSMITQAIKEEERRKALLKANTPEEVLAVFASV